MQSPSCFHIPPLQEGKPAPLEWAAVETAKGYVVERNFNETFDQAMTGCTWENLDSLAQSWADYEQAEQSWAQLEAQIGWGATWENLDYAALNWQQIEDNDCSWEQLERQTRHFEILRGPGREVLGSERGCAWRELDDQQQTWAQVEAADQSWAQWEALTFPGLPWNGLDSRLLSFAQWEEEDLTWAQWEALTSPEQHRGMTDQIPLGATAAIYRVKAYDADGVESPALQTDLIPVIPLFYRRHTQSYPVTAGKRYRILIRAQEVTGLDRVRMTLRYPDGMLTLTNFAAHTTERVQTAGTYPQAQLTIHSLTPGQVWFQSTKPCAKGECISGALTLVEFVANSSGQAALSLS